MSNVVSADLAGTTPASARSRRIMATRWPRGYGEISSRRTRCPKREAETRANWETTVEVPSPSHDPMNWMARWARSGSRASSCRCSRTISPSMFSCESADRAGASARATGGQAAVRMLRASSHPACPDESSSASNTLLMSEPYCSRDGSCRCALFRSETSGNWISDPTRIRFPSLMPGLRATTLRSNSSLANP